MISIDDAAKSLEFNRGLLQSSTSLLCTNSFKCGVEFAQRWIRVEDELPEHVLIVLAKSMNRHHPFIASYHAIRDKWYYYDFETNDFYKLDEVVEQWKPIDIIK